MKKVFTYLLLLLLVFSLVGVTKVAFSFQEKIEIENTNKEHIDLEEEELINSSEDNVSFRKIQRVIYSSSPIVCEALEKGFSYKRSGKLYLINRVMRI